MLSDYTTAELGLMLIKHDERRVILTQSKIREIRAEIVRREEMASPRMKAEPR